jgi:hypothetical protein
MDVFVVQRRRIVSTYFLDGHINSREMSRRAGGVVVKFQGKSSWTLLIGCSAIRSTVPYRRSESRPVLTSRPVALRTDDKPRACFACFPVSAPNAGPFPEEQQQKPLRGAPPLAPARSFPRLPRFACAALRFAPPFPLRLRSVPRVGDPPPLAVATPRLRQEAFGMYVHATAPI